MIVKSKSKWHLAIICEHICHSICNIDSGEYIRLHCEGLKGQIKSIKLTFILLESASPIIIVRQNLTILLIGGADRSRTEIGFLAFV